MFKDSSCQRGKWLGLFQERRVHFALTAEVLSRVRGAAAQILGEALLAVEGTRFCEEFAQRAAIRAVVKAALGNSDCVQLSYAKPRPILLKENVQNDNWPLEELPWAERAAFYLRNVLQYSRRDSALLIGVSDAQVDQLATLAERRIAAFERAADGSPEALLTIAQAMS